MIHIILDQENNKGLINIKGSNLEIANDFANFITQIYKSTPDIFILFTKVYEDRLKEIIKEEVEKNDKNNSSNKSDQ